MQQFLLVLLIASFSHAQTLLVPEKKISFSKYTENCKKEGYLCTHIFFDDKIKSAETPLLNQLIEDFDLLSIDFRKQMPQKIETLLKSEMISIEQAEIVLQMIEKSFQFDKNARLKYLQTELSQLIDRLKSTSEQDFESISYLVFKKRLTEKQFTSLHLSLDKLFIISVVTSFALPKKPLALEVQLVTGTCDAPNLNEALEGVYGVRHTQSLFQDECSISKSFNESFSQIKDGVVENRKTLFWISAAVGAYFLMNQYQVELNF